MSHHIEQKYWHKHIHAIQMDAESFKTKYSAELGGLTPARINTLWKKYAGSSHADILDAITHSQAAQAKDRQRRGPEPKVQVSAEPKVQPSSQSSNKPPSEPAEPLPTNPTPSAQQEEAKPDGKQEDEVLIPDWSEECKCIKIDPAELAEVVKRHARTIISRGGNVNLKLAKLFIHVNELISLRERAGDYIDVLSVLRAL